VVTTLGRSSAEYGMWFTAPAFGYMLGSFATSRLAQRHGLHSLIRAGLVVAVAGSLLNCVTAMWVEEWGLGALFLPQILVSFGNGLVLPNTLAGAVSVRPQAAGAAAGFSGFTQMAFGAFAAQTISYVVAGAASPLPLTVVALGYALIAAIPYFALVRRRR
jgi:DHA1 family bicyclomycin/chloramphenicol resistance-like MFS transporter